MDRTNGWYALLDTIFDTPSAPIFHQSLRLLTSPIRLLFLGPRFWGFRLRGKTGRNLHTETRSTKMDGPGIVRVDIFPYTGKKYFEFPDLFNNGHFDNNIRVRSSVNKRSLSLFSSFLPFLPVTKTLDLLFLFLVEVDLRLSIFGSTILSFGSTRTFLPLTLIFIGTLLWDPRLLPSSLPGPSQECCHPSPLTVLVSPYFLWSFIDADLLVQFRGNVLETTERFIRVVISRNFLNLLLWPNWGRHWTLQGGLSSHVWCDLLTFDLPSFCHPSSIVQSVHSVFTRNWPCHYQLSPHFLQRLNPVLTYTCVVLSPSVPIDSRVVPLRPFYL